MVYMWLTFSVVFFAWNFIENKRNPSVISKVGIGFSGLAMLLNLASIVLVTLI